MPCRGVRGATTAEANTPEAILSATRELLQALVVANDLPPSDLASAIFTTTPDLNTVFPARAARDLGWTDVALLCTHEMNVPGGLPKCIRVLLHWNTDKAASEIVHVYLKGATVLRPGLVPDREAYGNGSEPVDHRMVIGSTTRNGR